MKTETENTQNTMEQCMVKEGVIESLEWMDKDRKDFTNEDFIEAIVYDLHQINTFSENAINLLNELFGRVYDK